MQNGIILANVFGMRCGRGHFPLSFGRPGDESPCKLKHIAGRRVCPVSDYEAPEVRIRVSDQLPTAVRNVMSLRGFYVVKAERLGVAITAGM